MAIVDHVAADLRAEFPSMKGFSRSNVMSMRAFAASWSDPEFVQQPVGQIPWGHNLVLLTKLKDRDARLADAASTLKHRWSRAVLSGRASVPVWPNPSGQVVRTVQPSCEC